MSSCATRVQFLAFRLLSKPMISPNGWLPRSRTVLEASFCGRHFTNAPRATCTLCSNHEYQKKPTCCRRFLWYPHRMLASKLPVCLWSYSKQASACDLVKRSCGSSLPCRHQDNNPAGAGLLSWYPQTDSNRYLLLRTELFYPLNYGDKEARRGLCYYFLRGCVNRS